MCSWGIPNHYATMKITIRKNMNLEQFDVDNIDSRMTFIKHPYGHSCNDRFNKRIERSWLMDK